MRDCGAWTARIAQIAWPCFHGHSSRMDDIARAVHYTLPVAWQGIASASGRRGIP